MESKKTEKKAKHEAEKPARMKWIYVVGLDKGDLPTVVGKKRVAMNYQADPSKGEYEKYTDGARDAVVASLTERMDALRDFRHKQYVRAAKSLPTID